MEEKINIAEILKDKPVNTKLYSPLYGDVYFSYIGVRNNICVLHHRFTLSDFFYNGRYTAYKESEIMLFPSKDMRDWSKFTWKRGDVLISDCGFVCIFKEWASDDYTRFNGCYFDGMPNAETAKYSKLDNNTAYGYVRELENRCGGKLNIETLKIEKKTKFEDGDIIKMTWDKYSAIVIFWEYSNFGRGFDSHVFFNIKTKIIEYNIHGHTLQDTILRLATEDEKKQLFSALEKKGKTWDAKKKMIVDLKPKYEFKPMDLCLMKYIGQYNNRGWELCQYAYTEHRVSASGEQRDFYHAIGGEIYAECIPYKGNEHLLGTKKTK